MKGLLQYLTSPGRNTDGSNQIGHCSICITFQFLTDLLKERWNLPCKWKAKIMEVFIKENWIQLLLLKVLHTDL